MSTISAGTTSTTALVNTGDTTGNLVFQTNGTTTAMTIDTSQNLGLGVTPSAWGSGQVGFQFGADASLNATKTGGDLNISANAYYDGTNWRYIRSSVAVSNYYQTTGIHVWRYGASGTAGNTISWSEAMRLDNSGNLLVGTTSTGGGTERIVCSVTGGVKNGFLALATDTATAAALVCRNNSNTSVGTITFTTTATSYNTSSDYRLKDNPQPLTGSGAFIDALKPKTWQWKTDGSRGVGFIAHEVQEVSPSSVVGEKDGEQMQAMEYGSAEFIANIVAELQTLRARVAALEGAA